MCPGQELVDADADARGSIRRDNLLGVTAAGSLGRGQTYFVLYKIYCNDFYFLIWTFLGGLACQHELQGHM